MLKQFRYFMQRNRNKGISNLMLYLCLVNAALYFYIIFTNDTRPVSFMEFDANAIMHGEIWRCFTWIFARGADFVSRPIGFVYIFFYVMFNRWIGSVLERIWGTLRANIYFFGGALLSVLAGMVVYWTTGVPAYLSSSYLELSLFLAVATLIPEERVMLFGIFPVKMRWLAYLDLGLYVLEILEIAIYFQGTLAWMMFLMIATAPIIAILNYALHMGREMANLLPNGKNYTQHKRQREFKKAAQPNPDWAKNYRSSTGERAYRHKCTVCGRTDTENPGLEFRYCSRCKGYFCYCIDHINNHTHIEP